MSGSAGTDVLVVGAGPAGAAAAYWLAGQGHRVTVVERREFPRSKACGDVLSPRAVGELQRMGLGDALAQWHRLDGVQVRSHGRHRDLAWPAHRELPAFAVVARRRDLDHVVAAHAAAAGARVLHGHEAVEPIVERGFVRGATVRSAVGTTREMRADFVVVADGANSVFGRALGTFRTRGWPYATAIRSYWRSPRHDDPLLETSFDLTDRSDNILPGYGWVAPVGDGTVNVGVTLLSTARDFKGTNLAHLLEGFVHDAAPRWGIDPAAATGVVRVGRIPMGGSVQPTAGPTFVVAGDAAAAASPFTATGIDAAYETGRIAAEVLHDALTESGPTALQRYPRVLAELHGDQHKMARLWARLLGRPTAMRQLAHGAVRSEALAATMLRIMTGSTRADGFGAAELVERSARTLVKLAPDA